MDTNDAMRRALYAIENAAIYDDPRHDEMKAAINALRAALSATKIDAAALRLTAMREALAMIRDIARGSTTANTLPHIAKIAERAILAGSSNEF
jgi:hypothetical protein